PVGRAPAPMLLGDYVRKRLAAIDEATCRRLARPFDPGRASLPDRAELHGQLLESGASASKAAAKAFAMTIGRAHREYFLPGVEAVARWFADDGIIGAQITRTRDVTRGLLAHEGAVLETLVDAACRGGNP